MVKAGSSKAGLTRRSFLKTTAVVGGASVVAGGGSALREIAFAEETKGVEEEKVFRGVCRPNCFGYCHLNVHVSDGRVTKTSRAPYNNSCYDRICQRGLSHVQRIYDPLRLQYPLKRVSGTNRGDEQWERISWDEAYKEIAENIKSIQGNYGDNAVAILTASGNQGAAISSTYTRFRAVLNASDIGQCSDQASQYGQACSAGNYMSPLLGMMIWNGNELTDTKNAKTIVVWGANITDAQVQNWHLIREAHESGVKLVVVDPNYTQIASKADKWVPIRPGCDTLLKFALMNIVLKQQAEDREFLAQHTVAPFLVREDNGKFLRGSDVGIQPIATGEVDPYTGVEIIYDPYMVLSNGSLVQVSDNTPCDIEGTYTAEGIKCRTAFDLLVDRIKEYSPESVSETTEIPVDEIYELANICINGPVFHYEGYGPQAYDNGYQTTIAGLTLCALTGNLGKPGASYGSFWGYGIANTIGDPTYSAPLGPISSMSIPSCDLKNVCEQKKFGGQDYDIKMLFINCANPVCTNPDTHAWTDVIIPHMDYVVVADSAMTDTAKYADMVLPIAQWFEHEEIATSGQTCAYNYNEKAIEPPNECKPDTQILSELAEYLGLGEYFTRSNEEILETLFSGDINKMVGSDIDSIRERKEVRFIPGDPEKQPYIAYEGGQFPTSSGRFEFYRETPAVRAASTKIPTEEQEAREHLPYFEPPLEAWPENPLYEKYPFYLISERPRYRVHSQWFSTPLLREIDPEPIVKINPIDAKKKGLENGDYAEAFNDRGSAVAKVVYSEAVRPGTLLYPKGWQMYQHKKGGWSCLSSTDFNVYSVSNNFMDVLCDIRLWEEDDN
ncbi:molybdopterin-dependent oxidoreductase [Adlercreutzia sp. ZJ242]|uniref:molybdopterin-containing oxidoreductase family protein n=1 Tax=Adlercreutzia sp. ZJ242 TaxID=2709409 RepID=UPI0013ED62CF|nr:molybdopterin-dependent oxidoreductase [Adlercreutzia sp. ZJ242]